MSAEPEVQYVALRNIVLIVQRRPNILKHEMKVFFVKYNDPIYVKLEKLDVMVQLATEANVSQVQYGTIVFCVSLSRSLVRLQRQLVSHLPGL